MDISAFTTGTSGSTGSALSGQTSPLASKKAVDSRGLNKALNQGAIVSGLLPGLSSSRSGSTGFKGLSSDIYTAVGMQTQGMMSRGLMGMQIANISLGIDMSQAAKDAAAANPPDGSDEVEKDASETPATGAGAPDEGTPAPTRYFSNPDLSNPALGGLLDSLS